MGLRYVAFARFGYVDVVGTPAARTLASASALPVMLLLKDGQVACRSIRKNPHDDAYRAAHKPAQWREPSISMAA